MNFFFLTRQSRFFALLALASTLLLTAATCNSPDTSDKKNPAGSSTSTPSPSSPPSSPPPGPPGGPNPPPPPQKASAASKAAMDKLDTDLAQAASGIKTALDAITDTNKRKAEAQAILADTSFKSKLKAKIGTADINTANIIQTLVASLGDEAPTSLRGFLDSAVNNPVDLTNNFQQKVIAGLVEAKVGFTKEPDEAKIPGFLDAFSAGSAAEIQTAMEKLDPDNDTSVNAAFTWAGKNLANDNVAAAINNIFNTGTLKNMNPDKKTDILFNNLMSENARTDLKAFTSFTDRNLHKEDRIGLSFMLNTEGFISYIIAQFGVQIAAKSKHFKDLVKMHKVKSGLAGKAWNDRADGFVAQLKKSILPANTKVDMGQLINYGAGSNETQAKPLVLYETVAADDKLEEIISAISKQDESAKNLYDALINSKTSQEQKISVTQQLFVHNHSQIIKELIGVKLGSASAGQKSLFTTLITTATKAQLENVKFAGNKNLLDKLFEEDISKKIVHQNISYLLGKNISPTIAKLDKAKVERFLTANKTADRGWWDNVGKKFVNLLTGEVRKDAFNWLLTNEIKLSGLDTRIKLFAHALESLNVSQFDNLAEKDIVRADNFGFRDIVADASKLENAYNNVTKKQNLGKKIYMMFDRFYNALDASGNRVMIFATYAENVINLYNKHASALQEGFMLAMSEEDEPFWQGYIVLIANLDSTDNNKIHVNLAKTDWSIDGINGLLINIVASKIKNRNNGDVQAALKYLAGETKNALADYSEQQWQNKTKTAFDALTGAGISAADAKDILVYEDGMLPPSPVPVVTPAPADSSGSGDSGLASLGEDENGTWEKLISWIEKVVNGDADADSLKPEEDALKAMSAAIDKSKHSVGYILKLARVIPDGLSSDNGLGKKLKTSLQYSLNNIIKADSESKRKLLYYYLFTKNNDDALEIKKATDRIFSVIKRDIKLPNKFNKKGKSPIGTALNRKLTELVTKSTEDVLKSYQEIEDRAIKRMGSLGITIESAGFKKYITDDILLSNKKSGTAVSYRTLTLENNNINFTRLEDLYDITSGSGDKDNFYEFFTRKVVFNHFISVAIEDVSENKVHKNLIKNFLDNLPNKYKHPVSYYFAQMAAQFVTDKFTMDNFTEKLGVPSLYSWTYLITNKKINRSDILNVILGKDSELPDLLTAEFIDPKSGDKKSMLQIAWDEMPKGEATSIIHLRGPRLKETTLLENYLAQVSVKLWDKDKAKWAKLVGDTLSVVNDFNDANNKLKVKALLWPLVIHTGIMVHNGSDSHVVDEVTEVIKKLYKDDGSGKDIISLFANSLKGKNFIFGDHNSNNSFTNLVSLLPVPKKYREDREGRTKGVSLNGSEATKLLITEFTNKKKEDLAKLFQ